MEQAYKDLLEKYNRLLEENEKLKAELALLKGEDSLFMPEKLPTPTALTSAFNKYSSSEEKINLFRSLFKGREDVFARRWYSKTLDQSGYQPVCENEWNEEFCDKKKYKCSVCPNRKLMALTDKDIYRHLSGKDSYGRDVVGIYPMLTDETCLFLCADFDEENFKDDITAFRKTCEEFDIPVSIEISRSGNGAHAWIFFNEPISASVARKLGSGILTRTMEKSNLSFKSYDRFFPNQDTLSKGGFGNLVALPLQGKARKNGNSLFVDENFVPYPDQWEYLGCVRKITPERVEELVGVLSATTAFGKTVIASYLIGARKTNTLILVHTQSLMTQWQKSLEQFLTINITPPEKQKGRGRRKAWSPIGVLGAGKNALNGIVDIAVMQSLVSEDEVKELVRNYGMIIVDECHHVSAVNFEKILKFANVKYIYGLTATPTRQDGHHPIIFMQCGPIRYKVDAKSQAEKRAFEHYLILRFTPYRCENKDKNITEIYKDLAENELRNSYIVNDIIKAVKRGRVPIVLTERREHVLRLKDMLSRYCQNIITLFGTSSQKERRETFEKLQAIPDDENLIIIATGRYVGEGFDYPKLDTLFLALPIAWKGKIAQYAGRLHRNYPGKSEVQIYDYVDVHIPVLERMYQKRIKGYSSIGYKIKIDDEHSITPDLIYDGKSFYTVYCQDIKSAHKEVLIVCPFMRKNRILQLLKTFSQAILNGATVTVITRPPEDFKESEREAVKENTAILQNSSVNVIYKSDFHQKFIVRE